MLKSKKSMILVFVIIMSILTSMVGCSQKDNASPEATNEATNANETTTAPAEKQDFVIMIEFPDDATSSEVVKKIEEKFPNLNVISKPWSTNDAQTAIKTSVSADSPIDLAMYWPNQMETFVNADMALDLTPYLEANNNEWANVFVKDALNIGTYDGKVFAVPYASVYPMIEANVDIFEQAGVEVPEGDWTWEEFMQACATIKEKTGIMPVGLNSEWGCWTVRNGLLTSWDDKAQMESFIKGEIPFTDEKVVKVLDNAKELYENYCYPGEGAITASLDQINIAFKQGKIAMKMDVNVLAGKSVSESGLKNVAIVSWPRMGKLDYLLGGSNGYMIPVSATNPDVSAEVLKYITSPEVMQLYVDNGTPVAVNGVQSNDPNFIKYSTDSDKVYPKEITVLSPELNDYIAKQLPASYIFDSEGALKDLEDLRTSAN
jgi:ABC-type glycerol-3-phosphate transport system substrate-binding protein